MSDWKYHIGPATAQMLRDEHGITDADLIGMRCLVGAHIPPGKAYMIADQPKPPREKIEWTGLGNIYVKKERGVVSCDFT